jgi:23S rRNA (cytidine1920-2'-O)/16S rRNA (cytidine1409-2'-O)-methyltransferase
VSLSEPDGRPVRQSGGLKLQHALREFGIDARGLTCADLGASTGGFTDCLLQAGAVKVYSVDTAYGEFAWKLRNDPRVELMERTNALHATPPADGVDLVVADLGWTPQRLLIPVALKWLKPGGRIISLIKPHYELKDNGGALPPGGILAPEVASSIAAEVIAALPALGVRIIAETKSPILGGKAKSASSKGNAEWLVLLSAV